MSVHNPLSLRKNFSWTFLGNIIYGASQWVTIIVLAKISSPEVVGQFTLAVAVTSPIILLASLGLRAVQVTDAKQQYKFRDYLDLRIITTLVAVLIIIGVTFSPAYIGTTGSVILLVGLGKAIELISDIFQGLLQQHERMDRVSQSLILRSLASMATTIALLSLTNNLCWSLVGVIFISSIILFAHDIPKAISISHRSTPKLHWSTRLDLVKIVRRIPILSKLTLYSIPAGLIMMLLSLVINIPRYFIEQHLGQRELGIFAAIAYLPTVSIALINALGQSSLTRLSKYYSERNRKDFQLLIIKIIGIGLAIGFVGLLFSLFLGKLLLTVIYRSEYAEQSSVLNWLMFWGTLWYVATFLGYGVAATRYFKASLGCSFMLVAITLFSCNWLIPIYGLNGAAISLTIGGVAQLLGNLLIVGYALHQIR